MTRRVTLGSPSQPLVGSDGKGGSLSRNDAQQLGKADIFVGTSMFDGGGLA